MRKIEARWEGLEPAVDKPVFQLIDAEHPLNFYIGREMTGEYLFLLVDSERPPKMQSFRSVQIISSQRSDGQWTVLLRLSQAELSSVFALLCEDLVESSRQLVRGSSGVKIVARRMANWRRLMEGGDLGLLSAEKVRGLIGELLVLEGYFLHRLGEVDSINAWVGPLGSDQDFQMANEAWEVKTIQPDSAYVEIASETQLDSASRKINLTVITLNEVGFSSGYSLNQLIARIRVRTIDQPAALDAFDQRLVALGYLSRSEYDTPHFCTGSVSTFCISDGFPRVTSQNLILGVSDVRYKVQLGFCAPFEIETPFTLS